MKLTLVDLQSEIVDAWGLHFDGLADVSVMQGDILEVAENTIVSPANSFGYMDGGIDRIYIRHFGDRLQLELHEAIQRRPEGHLPIGASILVETGDTRVPFMIAAPTMYMPEPIPAQNCFYAMTAVLMAADKHSDVVSQVYCPGLGTGVGQVSAIGSAREMADAYRKWSIRKERG